MLTTRSYVLGYVVNFGGIFEYIWEEIIFLKGLVKFRKIGNIVDLVKVEHWNLKLEISGWAPKTVPHQPGVPCGVSTVWWCFKTFFNNKIPSLNSLRFHSNSGIPPP